MRQPALDDGVGDLARLPQTERVGGHHQTEDRPVGGLDDLGMSGVATGARQHPLPQPAHRVWMLLERQRAVAGEVDSLDLRARPGGRD